MCHAQSLGMDPDKDSAFLWLAEESLKAPVPAGWEIILGEEDGAVPFYFNETLNKSIWEHPLDAEYRMKFQKMKAMIGPRASHLKAHTMTEKEEKEDEDEDEIISLEEVLDDTDSQPEIKNERTLENQKKRQQDNLHKHEEHGRAVQGEQSLVPLPSSRPDSSSAPPSSSAAPLVSDITTSSKSDSETISKLQEQVVSLTEERASLQHSIGRLQSRLEVERMNWEEETNRRVLLKEKEVHTRIQKAVDACAGEWHGKLEALQAEISELKKGKVDGGPRPAIAKIAEKNNLQGQQLQQQQQQQQQEHRQEQQQQHEKQEQEQPEQQHQHHHQESCRQRQELDCQHRQQQKSDKNQELRYPDKPTDLSEHVDMVAGDLDTCFIANTEGGINERITHPFKREAELIATVRAQEDTIQRLCEEVQRFFSSRCVELTNSHGRQPFSSEKTAYECGSQPRRFGVEASGNIASSSNLVRLSPTTASSTCDIGLSSSIAQVRSNESHPFRSPSTFVNGPRSRIAELELALDVERLKVEKATSHERSVQMHRHERELQRLHDEISLQLPILVAAAVKRLHATDDASMEERWLTDAVRIEEAGEEAEGERRKINNDATEETGKVPSDAPRCWSKCSRHLQERRRARSKTWRGPVGGVGAIESRGCSGEKISFLAKRPIRLGDEKSESFAVQLLHRWRQKNEALEAEIAHLRAAGFNHIRPFPSSSYPALYYPGAPQRESYPPSPSSVSPPLSFAFSNASSARPPVAAAAASLPLSSAKCSTEWGEDRFSSAKGVGEGLEKIEQRHALEAWRRKYGRIAMGA